MEKQYAVYILTNRNNKVMYVGVTSNLERRLAQHKDKSVSGFTAKYRVDRLVYYELTNDVLSAIAREKEVKKWRREKQAGGEYKSAMVGAGSLRSLVAALCRDDIVVVIYHFKRLQPVAPNDPTGQLKRRHLSSQMPQPIISNAPTYHLKCPNLSSRTPTACHLESPRLSSRTHVRDLISEPEIHL
jgi:putative endonuclease